MAAWVNITADDLNDYLVADMVSAFREEALAEGQADPFATHMQDRCNYIRNRISHRISLSATPYAVPPELRTCACMLIIESMQTRLPIELTAELKRLIDRSYADLDLAGTDRLPVSDPDDPTTPAVQTGGGISVVKSGSSDATKTNMRGM